MNRMSAIVERELRMLFRARGRMMAAVRLPLVQLIVLGTAFGGKITNARRGIVDQDHGTQSLKIREAMDSIRANVRTIQPVYYTSETQAVADVRSGRLDGALVIPAEYSRRVYEQNHPRIALVVDNTDNFMSSTMETKLGELSQALNAPVLEPRLLQSIALDTVELYPYVEYMKYLLPGSITLARFSSVTLYRAIASFHNH